MADKQFFNKRKNRNNRSSNRFTPTAVERLDQEILEQISVLLSINPDLDDSTICKMYGISRNQADYIRKNQKKWDIVDKITKNGRD